MSFALLVFNCILCGHQDTGNLHRVPSLRVTRAPDDSLRLDPAGQREPLCRRCIQSINDNRAANRLAPFDVAEDAYEPHDEGTPA